MDKQHLALLLRENWAIDPTFALAAAPVLSSLFRGKNIDLAPFAGDGDMLTSFITPDGDIIYFDPGEDEKADLLPSGTIAVIGLTGVMQKFSGLCSYGTEDIASVLEYVLAVPAVSAALLRIHSPGGTVNSVIPLKRALAGKTKPVIAVVDSMAASAAYYVACMCDQVIAVDPLSEVGSIGAMAIIVNDAKKRKKDGEELIKIYAPQSGHKNRPAEEALEGNTETYAREILAPIAENFITHVREHRRGKLNEKAEGILSGKLFYATQAYDIGLVDGFGPLTACVARAQRLSHKYEILKGI
jgi:protease IV